MDGGGRACAARFRGRAGGEVLVPVCVSERPIVGSCFAGGADEHTLRERVAIGSTVERSTRSNRPSQVMVGLARDRAVGLAANVIPSRRGSADVDLVLPSIASASRTDKVVRGRLERASIAAVLPAPPRGMSRFTTAPKYSFTRRRSSGSGSRGHDEARSPTWRPSADHPSLLTDRRHGLSTSRCSANVRSPKVKGDLTPIVGRRRQNKENQCDS